LFRTASEDVTVEFQGGEPLLAFDKVEYAVNKILELNQLFNKRIQFVICCNLTVINDDILSFCKQHEILLSTSLDGPAFIHNANRFKPGRPSYELVIEGIAKAREALGHDRVSALMTTTALSLKHPTEIINAYVANGFHSIFLRPISPYGFALKNPRKNTYQIHEFLSFYKSGLEYILELNQRGISIKEDYTSIVLQKLLTPFATNYVDLQSPTGLVSSVVVFNYDGFVYASDEARMLAEVKDYSFRLGHVSEPYESLFLQGKALEIMHSGVAESLAGCSDCAFLPYCGTDPVLNHATQRDMEGHRALSIFCQKNMEIFRHIFEMLDNGAPEIERIFRSWIYAK
jgi:His-Xaa-Ser system radical SAM maturase HxsB